MILELSYLIQFHGMLNETNNIAINAADMVLIASSFV